MNFPEHHVQGYSIIMAVLVVSAVSQADYATLWRLCIVAEICSFNWAV